MRIPDRPFTILAIIVSAIVVAPLPYPISFAASVFCLTQIYLVWSWESNRN
jgi:hypothetical protein